MIYIAYPREKPELPRGAGRARVCLIYGEAAKALAEKIKKNFPEAKILKVRSHLTFITLEIPSKKMAERIAKACDCTIVEDFEG